MSWLVADENGPMLCGIEIPQSSNYGGRGGGGGEWVQAFGATTSGIVLQGFVNGCLENHLPGKTNASPQKIPFSLSPKPACT